MLRKIALLAIAAPRRILAIAALIMVAAAVFGIPVAKNLSAGGFQDPTSESAQATKMLTDKFHQGDMQLLVTVTAPDGVKASNSTAVATDIEPTIAIPPTTIGSAAATSPPNTHTRNRKLSGIAMASMTSRSRSVCALICE